MLGMKEICGLAFLFVCSVTKPVTPKHKKECLLDLQEQAKDLFESFKKATQFKSSDVDSFQGLIKNTIPGLLNCSRSTRGDLNVVATFNTLFINLADHSYERSNQTEGSQLHYVNVTLLTVIGQQSVCLKNHKKSETDNLFINYTIPKTGFDWNMVYYHVFDCFKDCMQKLTGPTV